MASCNESGKKVNFSGKGFCQMTEIMNDRPWEVFFFTKIKDFKITLIHCSAHGDFASCPTCPLCPVSPACVFCFLRPLWFHLINNFCCQASIVVSCLTLGSDSKERETKTRFTLLALMCIQRRGTEQQLRKRYETINAKCLDRQPSARRTANFCLFTLEASR